MKKQILMMMSFLFVMWACSEKEMPEEKGIGYLALNIGSNMSLKSGVTVEDFTLRITTGNGTEVLKERIGDLPSQIALTADNYTVEAYSVAFTDPKFETPCYSGSTAATIVAGETTETSLVCSQSNAGIKIIWSDEFADNYQTYQAEARCTSGYLTYSADESRTGYFPAGNVSLKISADGQTLNGGTLALSAKDLVTVTLRPKMSPSGSLSIDILVDETVNERAVEIIVEPDEESAENSETNPYFIAGAISKQGETGVWVVGYIVGSKPSSGWDFISGTWQATNLILADAATETDYTKCIPVELPTGSIRTNLNLTDHPELLHRKIVVKGSLENYYSRPGLRSITTYSIK